METVFRLNSNELNSKFLDIIKQLFAEKEVEISIKSSVDETEYLMSEPANRRKLMKAIKNVEKNKNLIHFTGEEFLKLANKLSKA